MDLRRYLQLCFYEVLLQILICLEDTGTFQSHQGTGEAKGTCSPSKTCWVQIGSSCSPHGTRSRWLSDLGLFSTRYNYSTGNNKTIMHWKAAMRYPKPFLPRATQAQFPQHHLTESSSSLALRWACSPSPTSSCNGNPVLATLNTGLNSRSLQTPWA